jgi:RPA family protein
LGWFNLEEASFVKSVGKAIANTAYMNTKEEKKRKVKRVMQEYKEGELHSGSKKGKIVKKRKQAVAIALSEARKKKK